MLSSMPYHVPPQSSLGYDVVAFLLRGYHNKYSSTACHHFLHREALGLCLTPSQTQCTPRCNTLRSVCSGCHDRVPPPGWLNRPFSHCSAGWKCKIQVLAGFMSSEASLWGLQMAAFLVCSHMAFPLLTCIPVISSFSHKDTSPIDPRWPHLTLKK